MYFYSCLVALKSVVHIWLRTQIDLMRSLFYYSRQWHMPIHTEGDIAEKKRTHRRRHKERRHRQEETQHQQPSHHTNNDRFNDQINLCFLFYFSLKKKTVWPFKKLKSLCKVFVCFMM